MQIVNSKPITRLEPVSLVSEIRAFTQRYSGNIYNMIIKHFEQIFITLHYAI